MIAPEESDDDLVARTAGGDKLAFVRLVTRHRGRLLALTARILGSRAAAEDVVQEVVTRAWINAPHWQAKDAGRASYAAWLSRVAVNLAIDQTRKARPTHLDDVDEPVDGNSLPDVAMIAEERHVRLKAAIAALPERQRVALSLTYDAELSNAEGAATMAVSVGAFELLLVRARKALRLAMTEA